MRVLQQPLTDWASVHWMAQSMHLQNRRSLKARSRSETPTRIIGEQLGAKQPEGKTHQHCSPQWASKGDLGYGSWPWCPWGQGSPSWSLTCHLLALMWKGWRFYLNLINSLETSLHPKFLSNVPLNDLAGVQGLGFSGSKQSCLYLGASHRHAHHLLCCFPVWLSTPINDLASSWENGISKTQKVLLWPRTVQP